MASVHPRACGEQGIDTKAMAAEDGSSPRLRGTGSDGRPRCGHGRFIPAPAGNRPEGGVSCHLTSVHPRACGEQEPEPKPEEPEDGSSPRLRGTVPPPVRLRHGRRFIPAPAGNRSVGSRIVKESPVHPRACGEQSTRAGIARFALGSSPRLRGTVLRSDINWSCPRFIPAPAGNSPTEAYHCHDHPVHPRACGEQCWTGGAPLSIIGSSPRLRGTDWS